MDWFGAAFLALFLVHASRPAFRFWILLSDGWILFYPLLRFVSPCHTSSNVSSLNGFYHRYYMLSLAKPQQLYQVFLAQGVAMGVGLGFLFLPGLAITAHHFKKRRTLAMGIVMSGSSSGGMLFPWLVK